MDTAYFAGGCFWCITPVLKAQPGVTGVTSGYSGGTEEDPSYEDVKAQRTQHRETVRVTFDSSKTPYSRLLFIYLKNVDPFDGEGQFIDRGRSYSPAIYYTDEAQRAEAEAQLNALAAECGRPVQIALEPFRSFYPAEEYHQDYYLKNPEAFAKELEESGRAAWLAQRDREEPGH